MAFSLVVVPIGGTSLYNHLANSSNDVHDVLLCCRDLIGNPELEGLLLNTLSNTTFSYCKTRAPGDDVDIIRGECLECTQETT